MLKYMLSLLLTVQMKKTISMYKLKQSDRSPKDLHHPNKRLHAFQENV